MPGSRKMEKMARRARRIGLLLPMAFALALASAAPSSADPDRWRWEWPVTDFTRHSIPYDEILSGGPPKEGIPAINDPHFEPVSKITNLGEQEPVITLRIGEEVRAYPLRVLTWHEIANDTLAGVPVAVTYCPLCNAALVFDRRLDGQVLDFGTTGKLRHSDLVMYDRQTESWWQQFTGEAIVGELTGKKLKMLPSRLEAWGRFRDRYPEAEVLVPNDPNRRRYGANPYVGYDSEPFPFLYKGEVPEGIEPLARVIVVGSQAWSLDLLRREGSLTSGELVLTWEPGQNSALDTREISEGRDVGNVIVERVTADGREDALHHVTFAFVFHAFQPDGTLYR